MADKINLSLSDIINNSQKNNEFNTKFRENTNKYKELKSELPRTFEKYRGGKNQNKYSRGIENRRWERNDRKHFEPRNRDNDTLSYRLLKISNLNINVTNEDLRVS